MDFSVITSSYSKIGIDKFNRGNFKTSNLAQEIANFTFADTVRLKDLFFVISGFAFKSADYVGEGIPLVRIGDLNGYELIDENMVFLPEEYYEDAKYSKYIIKKNDILVSLTGDGNIKCLLVNDDEKRLLNQRVAILRAKYDLNTKFYYWLLNSNYIKKQFSYFSNGKSQLNISPFDLKNMFVPVIEDNIQKDFIKRIEPLEKEINANIRLIKSKRSIIDAYFCEYFNYDYEKFESLKKKRFITSFAQYGNNIDTRFSAKFHRPAGEFVYDELLNRPNQKIKKCLVLPMITGQGIETTDYDENGDYAYVSMADISSWALNIYDIKYVSNEYAKRKLTKKIQGSKIPISTEIALNDILLMRSGEGGIGKVAIVEDEIKGIFCDFIIRMRFDENQINPMFAYYFFCTRYFQYLVEINKKGLGNNTNIFPNQIQEFPIPYISLVEQQQIIKNIKDELDKQKIIDKEIQQKKSEIETILTSVIK